MPNGESRTLAEIGRTVDRLEQSINEVKHDVKNLRFLDPAYFEIAYQQVVDDVKELQEWRKWLGRSLFAALLTAVTTIAGGIIYVVGH
jgi:hypothetical protein